MEGPTDLEVYSHTFFERVEASQRATSEPTSRLPKAASRTSRPRVQRRLATIVAADVVGYSRLMGRDEEGAVRRLRELQATISPIVKANRGRIVSTAGDAMIIEFSSSVAAFHSALTIQEVVGLLNCGVDGDDKMLFRIGVNVGAVIVEGGDVFGEVVNIASRLEAIAEPGGICVSHACYVQTRGQFAVNFAYLGEQRLKNIAEPVRAYAVRRPWAEGDVPTAVSPRSGARAVLSSVVSSLCAAREPISAGPAEDLRLIAAAARHAERPGNSERSPEVAAARNATNLRTFAADPIDERADQRQVKAGAPSRVRNEGLTLRANAAREDTAFAK
jgi:class 3 adenylate cyclase